MLSPWGAASAVDAPVSTTFQIRDAASELGYQQDETFCLKIGQLRELVRSCGIWMQEGWVGACQGRRQDPPMVACSPRQELL